MFASSATAEPPVDNAVSSNKTADFIMTDLGTLGGSSSEARSVNDHGQVVGVSENESGYKRGFLWENDVMTEIPGDEASDLNDDGIVVGTTKLGTDIFGRPESQAFRWSKSEGIETDLLPRVNVGLSPKKLTGHARAINRDGDIAMIGQGIAMYAIVRNANGECTDLGHLGGMVSLPYDINDKGEVVGYTKVGRTTVHAFLYRNGTLLDIGTLGLESGAHGVNNKSEVVGSSKDRMARFRGFLWSNGNMKDIGTLGGETTNARGINDQSWVVGNSTTADGGTHGFVFRNGMMQDLNDICKDTRGWVIEDAFGINNKNQIAAVAERNGLKHAVLLSPPQMDTVAAKKPALSISRVDYEVEKTEPTQSLSLTSPASSDRAVVTYTEDSNLVSYKLETTVTPVAKAPTGYKVVEAFATTSPDFTRVAFTAERDDEKRRCAVIDGKVHPEYLIVNDIVFSPDSRRVAYSAKKSGQQGGLLYVDGKLTSVREITKSLQFTPDSKHVVYVEVGDFVTRNDGRSQWIEMPAGIVWDSVPQPKYGTMGAIRVGQDSQTISFTGTQGGRPVVVVGGETIGTYNELPEFPFSPAPLLSPDGKRHAFVARRSGNWFTVVDGRESTKSFASIDSLAFSPDSTQFAFCAGPKGRTQVYQNDSVVGPAVERVIGKIQFSPDSSRLSIPVLLGKDSATVMVDGELQEAFSMISSAEFSPDSKSWAFWGKNNKTASLVCNGQRWDAYEDFDSVIEFSPDSKKLATIAKQGEKFLLVINNEPMDHADEIDASSVKFSPNSQLIAYWARHGESWQLCVNGVTSRVNFKSVVNARPQVIDFDNYQSPSLYFASETLVRAVGINSAGEFCKIEVSINDASMQADKDSDQLVANVENAGVEFGVLNDNAGLYVGEKRMGSAAKGTRFAIESRHGEWVRGTFRRKEETISAWVSAKFVDAN